MKDKNKVAVVGTVGIPACYGGFESLVENLTRCSSNDIQYVVFCSSRSYKTKKNSHNGAKLKYLPFSANGAQSVLYDIASLIKCCVLKPNTVLILGVSGCMFLPIFRFLSSSKVVTNIDGLEWKRDKWGKYARKFLKWSESLAVKYSDVVVTDNKAISDYVLNEYGIESITIAYGGDHALRDNMIVKPTESSYALGLCRIEPENNVQMILEAFTISAKRLKFVGNWTTSQFGRDLKEKYSTYSNIELIDPIYDIDELYSLRKNCSLYVHGHSAGGTNPSLVEMMHFGVPILAFDCSFNRYSTENKANYFHSEIDLNEIINNLDERIFKENGDAMLDIAKRKYTWKKISNLYESSF